MKTLGAVRLRDAETFVAYGKTADLAPSFWLLAQTPQSARPGYGLHVSFSAVSEAAVDAFYRTALAHGATDAGAPGHRPQYTAYFYGAFVLDLDGFKIEATYRR